MCSNQFLDFSNIVIQRGDTLLSRLDVRDNNHAQITASVLYGKMISDLQAIIWMVEKGFIDQSFAVLRTMLDKLFVVSAIANDESRMIDLIKHYEYQQTQKIKKAHSLGMISAEEREARLKKLDGKPVQVSRWAEWANMEETYKREYTLFSDFIHVSLNSVQDCLVIDADKIKAINIAPDSSRKDEVVITASYYLLIATEKVSDFFKVQLQDQDEVEKIFAQISSPYYRKRCQEMGE